MGLIEIFDMEIPQLHRMRTIRVYLPEGYEKELETTYPVLYMHDGQNLFDIATSGYGEIWDVHSSLDLLTRETNFKGAIVVGIDNGTVHRLNEYSPWVSSSVKELKLLGDIQEDIGGEGVLYGQFIVETLKPYVDAHYRTKTGREDTGVAGSSMGGFISLYLGVKYPEVFSKIGAFSTAVWFASEELLAYLASIQLDKPIRWYLDIGTNETSNPEKEDFNQLYLNGTRSVEKKLLEVGVSRELVRLVVEEDAIHNERDWARRFPEAFKWLFEI